MKFYDLASGIYVYDFEQSLNGFDQPEDAIQQISGWLEENLGRLNATIDASFSGVSGEVDLNLEEQAIFKELYMYNYYNRESRKALKGILDGDGILNVRDGDQSISFQNRNEVAKVYKGLARDSQSRMDSLVQKYSLYKSYPRQVGESFSGTAGGYYC
jgi:hypothetical protein